jgi:hypothetical protein
MHAGQIVSNHEAGDVVSGFIGITSEFGAVSAAEELKANDESEVKNENRGSEPRPVCSDGSGIHVAASGFRGILTD